MEVTNSIVKLKHYMLFVIFEVPLEVPVAVLMQVTSWLLGSSKIYPKSRCSPELELDKYNQLKTRHSFFSEVPLVINIMTLNKIVGSAYCVAFITIALDLAYGKWMKGAVLQRGWRHF